MSEEEKINIIRTIREELQSHRDYADVKYATKESLTIAKEARDATCESHRVQFNSCVSEIKDRLIKGDKQFIYMMFAIAIVGAIAGIDNLIPILLKFIGIG